MRSQHSFVVKLRVRTDYLGHYQYEGDNLRFFPHAEGRVLRFANATSWAVAYQREYTLADHLSSLRLAYRAGRAQQVYVPQPRGRYREKKRQRSWLLPRTAPAR